MDTSPGPDASSLDPPRVEEVGRVQTGGIRRGARKGKGNKDGSASSAHREGEGWWSHLLAAAGPTSAASERPACRFIQTVAELVLAGKVTLLLRRSSEQEIKVDQIGWIDDDGVYLLPGAAMDAVRKFWRDNGFHFVFDQRQLRDDLVAIEAIVTDRRRRIATVRAGGMVRKVLRLKREAVEIILKRSGLVPGNVPTIVPAQAEGPTAANGIASQPVINDDPASAAGELDIEVIGPRFPVVQHSTCAATEGAMGESVEVPASKSHQSQVHDRHPTAAPSDARPQNMDDRRPGHVETPRDTSPPVQREIGLIERLLYGPRPAPSLDDDLSVKNDREQPHDTSQSTPRAAPHPFSMNWMRDPYGLLKR